MPEQSGEGLEEPQGIAGFGHCRQARGEELGKQPSELREPDAFEALQGSCIHQDCALPQRIDPRPEGQDLLALVRAAEQDGTAPARSLCREISQQPALTDPGLADDRHDLAVSGPGRGHDLVELGHLGVAADERAIGGPGCTGERHRHHLTWALSEDLLIERLGLGLGLDAQLALEDLDALLILPERGGPAPELPVQPHQRPVHGLLQRVEREQAKRRLHCGCGGAARALVSKPPRERFERQFAQPLSLRHEPVLEDRLGHAEPRQQVAAIEPDRLLKGRRRSLADGAFEGSGVRLDRIRGQRDGISRQMENLVLDTAKSPPEDEERLP